jgi:acyl-coenzyme A thioesterase PaaI-like protein
LPSDTAAPSVRPQNWFQRVSYGPQEKDAYERMVATLRRFLDSVAGARPDEAALAALTQDLAAWSERLEDFAVADREQPFGRLFSRPGRGQALSPAVVLEDTPQGQVRGKVIFGRYFLGVNGAVHGGAIPLVFDELFGRAAAHRDRPRIRTAYLNVDFRAITPLDRELDISAWLERVEGRKLFVRGELRDGEVVCAQADGLFVELRPEQS